VYAPTDGNRILERLPDETVTPATPAGALAAIARCAANAAGRFDAVDVLLPESLLLLEPEDAILADARRKIALGAIHQVALRFGGRISPWTNWDLLFSTCARIQHDDPSPLWLEVPDLDDYDGVIDRVAEHGRGVAFVTPPRSSNGTPSEALVGALSESPVVVWPLTEPPEGHDLQGYVTTHWKSLFVEVAEARRKLRRPGSHMAEPHSCLRVAWEDSEWLKFAQWYTREMVGQ
jgi:hypothetical protein